MPGPKTDKIWADAVNRAVKRRLEKSEGKPQKLERLADKLVSMALSGDMQAIKEIGDRLDGRPFQSVDHSSKDGTMTPQAIEIRAVIPEHEEEEQPKANGAGSVH